MLRSKVAIDGRILAKHLQFSGQVNSDWANCFMNGISFETDTTPYRRQTFNWRGLVDECDKHSKIQNATIRIRT